MKKLIFSLLVLVIIVSVCCIFTACDSGVTICPAPEDTPKSSETIRQLRKYSLGYGVNAFSAETTTENYNKTLIFDVSKLPSDLIEKHPISSTEAESHSYSSLYDAVYNQNFGLLYTHSSGVDIMGFFNASVKNKFSLDANISLEKKTNQFYFTLQHILQGDVYQLSDYKNIETYLPSLSDVFVSDVKQLATDKMSVERFVDKYGTHIVTAINYGGMLELNYSLFAEDKIEESALKMFLNNEYQMSIQVQDVSGSYGSSFETRFENTTKLSYANTTKNLYVRMAGGNSINCFSFEEVAKSYPQWVESINSEQNWAVIGVAKEGLIPIWDYVPPEYEYAKKRIMEYCRDNSNSMWKSLTDKMQGENGTVDHPYSVANRDDFLKMINNCRYSKIEGKTAEETKVIQSKMHYILVEDIDLGDWKNYGVGYWPFREGTPSDAFIGFLDGNNHKIDYSIHATADQNPAQRDNNTYGYGLFPCIVNSEIKNLNVNANLKISGGYAYHSFAGGIMGYSMGSALNNCEVRGNIWQDEVNVKYVRSGGIAGCAYATQFKSCFNYALIKAFYKTGYIASAAGICGVSDGSSSFNSCKNMSKDNIEARDNRTNDIFVNQ